MLKTKLIIIVMIITIIASVSYSENSFDDLTSDCMTYWNYNTSDSAPPEAPIDYYIDSVHLFSKRHFHSIKKDSLIIIDTIGEISDRQVIDIIFKGKLGEHYRDVGKMTLINSSPQKYRILYNFFSDPACIKYYKSNIIHSDSFDFLLTKAHDSGKGRFKSEQYWVYNKIENCFNTFSIFPPKSIFIELTPDSCKARYFDFDIDKLYYYCYFYSPNDYSIWSTCGKLSVWYKFDGCELKVFKSEFNPNDTAFH